MRKTSLKLLALIPTFTLISVVGAGFATWYFSGDLGTATTNTNVDIIGVASANYDVQVAGQTYLVLDQASDPSDARPEAEIAKGVYLTDQAAAVGRDGTDEIAVTVRPTNFSSATTVTLAWEATWGDTTENDNDAVENVSKYLTLNQPRGELELQFVSASEQEVLVSAHSETDIELGLNYGGEVGEPETRDEYVTMYEELSDLKLTIVFTIVEAVTE